MNKRHCERKRRKAKGEKEIKGKKNLLLIRKQALVNMLTKELKQHRVSTIQIAVPTSKEAKFKHTKMRLTHTHTREQNSGD